MQIKPDHIVVNLLFPYIVDSNRDTHMSLEFKLTSVTSTVIVCLSVSLLPHPLCLFFLNFNNTTTLESDSSGYTFDDCLLDENR